MNNKLNIRKLIFMPLTVLALLLYPVTAQAVPTLQLDIDGGTYNMETETIIAPDSVFTVYAYLTNNGTADDLAALLADTYYLSIALLPGDNLSGQSFTIDDGTTTNTVGVTDDMIYGTPPVDIVAEQFNLPGHGVFPTYYYEEAFQFSESSEISQYNTQDRAIDGGGIDLSYDADGDMYYFSFEIDRSGLSGDYNLHFDLYNTAIKNYKRGDTIDIVNDFAPFSHDAESVPEPATVLLLGLGLLGLWGWTKRFGTASIGK